MFPSYDPLRLHLLEVENRGEALERVRRARQRRADAAPAPVRTVRATRQAASRLALVVRE